MKVKKIISTLCLTMGILLTTGISAFAQENVNVQVANENSPSYIEGIVDITEANTTVSDVLTFDEIVKKIAESNNISEKVVANNIISSSYKNVQRISGQGMVSPMSATYRTLTAQFTVTSSYRPSVTFYCQTDEWPGSSFRAIDRILNVGLDRSNNGMSKQFSGSVYTNLENANKIYFNVNGDFYNNGTTTINGGINIGVGESGKVTFGASYSTSHYSYCNAYGYKYF